MTIKDNTLAATSLIQALISSGCTHFVLSPGSRVTPLAMALAHHPEAHSYVHFDERGAAFFALGLAKARKKPAAILTTSGTAVGNLLPAIMEADQLGIPLIVITADRPQELIDCGANQTTRQSGIFKPFVRFDHTFAVPSNEVPASYFSSTIAYAIKRAKEGPIHLNCPFREPLYEDQKAEIFQPNIHYVQALPNIDATSIPQNFETLFQEEKGVIVLGNGAVSSKEEAKALFHLSKKLKYPLFADVTSGYRGYGYPGVSYHPFLLKTLKTLKPSLLLHFGGRLVSKSLDEWYKAVKVHIQVKEEQERLDPFFSMTHHFPLSSLSFCNLFQERFKENPSSPFFASFCDKEEIVKSAIQEHFSHTTAFSEAFIAYELGKQLDLGMGFFCANSMPIRHCDSFFYPEKEISFFSQRGVSGIDGNIATAAGLACGLNRPFIALLGDQAALHDLSSLSLVHETKQPFAILIINNFGGGIFSFLKVRENNPHFEKFFGAAHPYDFAHAAKLFDLNYVEVASPQELTTCLKTFTQKASPILIEAKTSREETRLFYQEIEKHIEERLCSFTAI